MASGHLNLTQTLARNCSTCWLENSAHPLSAAISRRKAFCDGRNGVPHRQRRALRTAAYSSPSPGTGKA